RIERGTQRLTHVALVAGVAQGLHIPGHLLGFPDFAPQPGPERAPSYRSSAALTGTDMPTRGS
ncbi:MAG: hypothetical protein ACRDTE_04875, partial [Pseudonocardiaceae bacterium]